MKTKISMEHVSFLDDLPIDMTIFHSYYVKLWDGNHLLHPGQDLWRSPGRTADAARIRVPVAAPDAWPQSPQVPNLGNFTQRETPLENHGKMMDFMGFYGGLMGDFAIL